MLSRIRSADGICRKRRSIADCSGALASEKPNGAGTERCQAVVATIIATIAAMTMKEADRMAFA